MSIWKKEPALLLGVIQALIVLGVAFGLQLTAEQTGAILAVLAALIALLTRQQVASPATAETLARGTLQSNPTPKQQTKAKEILGIPAQAGTVIPPDLRLLAEQYAHLLPIPYPQIVAQGGLVALELALKTAQNAAKRPATWEESEAVIKDLGKGL
jgi:hypothetical protein